jgi:hypothetical protein
LLINYCYYATNGFNNLLLSIIAIITIIAYYFEVKIWVCTKEYIVDVICIIRIILNITIIVIIATVLYKICCHIMHTLVGGAGQHDGFNALDYRKIKHGDAGILGNHPVLSVPPDKVARFLYEFHYIQFSGPDLPPLPADRSDFDVHGAIKKNQVWILLQALNIMQWRDDISPYFWTSFLRCCKTKQQFFSTFIAIIVILHIHVLLATLELAILRCTTVWCLATNYIN